MSDRFDGSRPIRTPVLSVASGVALARAILAAFPKHAPAMVRKAAEKVRKDALDLQKAWGESEAAAKPSDARPADQAIDHGWASLHQRLDAYAQLSDERHPKAKRAQELLETIFPDGLTFLKLPHRKEWAESQKRLDQIEKAKLGSDLEVLVGKEFLSEVRHTHDLYGKALNVTAVRVSDAPALLDPLRALAGAVRRYEVQVVAWAEDSEGKADEAASAALKPIDDERQTAKRRRQERKDAAPPATPITPLPEVTAPPR